MKPEFSAIQTSELAVDPIAFWKQQSADGEGRQILAVLSEILAGPAVRIGAGTSGERFVWPALAETDLGKLTPAQEVQLYRLVPHAEAAALRAGKRWTWWRLAIGADGTWHSFLKAD